MEDRSLDVPAPSGGDVAHIGMTTLLSLVPFAGAAELFKFIVDTPIEKRRQEWMQNVVDAIRDLQSRTHISIKDLQNSEEFVTLLIKASHIAFQTHIKEKHTMLKNGLVNYFSDNDFNKSDFYFSLISQLSLTHLTILKYLKENENYFFECSHFGSLVHSLIDAKIIAENIDWSELRAYLMDIEQAGLVLFSRNFLSVGGQVNTVSVLSVGNHDKEKLPHARITAFGEGLFLFIQSI